ncbi:unnamed protein product [Microthlaspi erraticum]|uniref:Uncharacterized protein n=1 Tax=Microthlaspi erraticum TaxID=1685480 RepID=A0A6D2IEJ9_9BRAS|nr:unnamed protein product [Microthlaspi erraticum]
MNVKVTDISNPSVPLPRERRSNALNAKEYVAFMVAIEEKCDSSDSESVEDSSEAEANLIGMSSESEEEDDS